MPCKTTRVHLRTYTNFFPPRSDRHKVLCLPHNFTRQASSSQSKVPAYCKCHAKRAAFTCAPKKLDTFSSFRPSQTVTKYCACHTILRVSMKVANRKSQRIVNAMQNEPCSLAHLKDQTLSVPPAQVKPSQSIAPATQNNACTCGHLRT